MLEERDTRAPAWAWLRGFAWFLLAWPLLSLYAVKEFKASEWEAIVIAVFGPAAIGLVLLGVESALTRAFVRRGGAMAQAVPNTLRDVANTAIALAIRWCEDHLPGAAPPVLVHGDYRMGNVMVDAEGLAAVLDWELAHRGDAHEDLAFGCMAVWRFGRLDRPAFGLGSLEDYFAAYEAAGGVRVDRERFRFWLVYRTLWWALGCLQMGAAWRSGADRTVERKLNLIRSIWLSDESA